MNKALGLMFVAVLAFAGCAKREASLNGNSTEKENQIEKVKPAPGTGNVQGKVLYNGKPVENIDVRLCETFSRFLSGCGGQVYTAKTDKDGDFVITNVPPKEYQGLTVRIFDTDGYVFATTGIAGIGAQKYNVEADKTLFVNPTNLFKADLKLVNPKAGSSVSDPNVEFTWDAYPDAAYYKLTLTPDNHLSESRYVNQRIDGTTFKATKPLEKGGYQWKVEAFNSADKKLSESDDRITFTVQ
ncbi:MAG TPA: carboxypeptidase-like regulatory domain-containing protein [Pyrinomonadaceae bacterium]